MIYEGQNESFLDKMIACPPALIYLVIAVILLLSAIFMALFQGQLGMGFFSYLSSQCISIICCALLIFAVCNLNMTLAWILIACLVCSLISGSTGGVFNNLNK